MTKQEAFDQMVAHLRQQKAFSFRTIDEDEDGPYYQCAYRGEGGVACAVGCLIPDELYSPAFENHIPTSEDVRRAKRWDTYFTEFLRSAQYELHDSLWSGETADVTFDMKRFEAGAKRLAKQWGLQYQPPVMEEPA